MVNSASARWRFDEGMALAATGYLTGAIYLWGYCAEMTLKAAYFSLLGRGEMAMRRVDTHRVISQRARNEAAERVDVQAIGQARRRIGQRICVGIAGVDWHVHAVAGHICLRARIGPAQRRRIGMRDSPGERRAAAVGAIAGRHRHGVRTTAGITGRACLWSSNPLPAEGAKGLRRHCFLSHDSYDLVTAKNSRGGYASGPGGDRKQSPCDG